VAAVDEDQFRHIAHLGNVAWRQETARADDHAGDLAGGGRVLVHAVAGQVQDAPAVLVQGLHDRRGWLVDAVDDLVALTRELVGHRLRFLAGAR